MEIQIEKTLENVLLKLHPFDVLTPEVLSSIAGWCRIEEVSDGHVLIKQGECLGFLFGILAGSLKTVQIAPDGKTKFESRLSAGQFGGWVSVFDDRPTTTTIIAQGKVNLILIPLAQAKRLVFESPRFSEAVFKILCEMLRKVESDRLLLSLPNAFQRVYFHLYRLYLQDKNTSPRFILPKQNEIACHVNASRETVSRAIQLLIKQDILTKEGHIIFVKSKEYLKQVAEIGLREQV